MRLPKFRYALLLGGLIGLVGPIAVLLYVISRNILFPPDWVFVPWPSLIMFIVVEDRGNSSLPLLSLAVATNILIYMFVAASIWSAAWVIRGWRESLRDGTTI